MSWDLLILNSSEPVDFKKEDWKDFESTKYVSNRIKKHFQKVLGMIFLGGI